MELDKIKSISFSLMKRETEIDMEQAKAEYTKKASAKFIVPEGYFQNEGMVETMVIAMYDNLKDNVVNKEDVDSLGLWIGYEDIVTDNAISLTTLDAIGEYSAEKITPVFEFFKMTLPE
jgi:hypothetical protein